MFFNTQKNVSLIESFAFLQLTSFCEFFFLIPVRRRRRIVDQKRSL